MDDNAQNILIRQLKLLFAEFNNDNPQGIMGFYSKLTQKIIAELSTYNKMISKTFFSWELCYKIHCFTCATTNQLSIQSEYFNIILPQTETKINFNVK